MFPTWLWIIIINGVVLGLITYIWRGLEGRVNKMETREDLSISKLLEHPVLTIEAHAEICKSNLDHMKSTIQTQTELLLQKMAETEARTALLIENAILRAFANGKSKKAKK